MRMHIEFDMNNAAFEGDACGTEVARILRKIAAQVLDCDADYFTCDGGFETYLRDCNGNKVGAAWVAA